jgi:hypothetical protein
VLDGAGVAWLQTISNVQAREWWAVYIGSGVRMNKFTTFVDAMAAWLMKEVQASPPPAPLQFRVQLR